MFKPLGGLVPKQLSSCAGGSAMTWLKKSEIAQRLRALLKQAEEEKGSASRGEVGHRFAPDLLRGRDHADREL